MNAETAASIFESWDRDTPPADGLAEAWRTLEDAGLTLLSIPENSGGNGGTLREAAAVLRLAGRHAASAPLAETALLAAWALSASGIPVPEGGPLTAAPAQPGEHVELRREEGSGLWRLHGRAARVPWARAAARLAVICRSVEGETFVALANPEECEVSPGENLAGEPRDEVVFGGVQVEAAAPAPEGVDEEGLLVRGALARTVQIAGAMEWALELSLVHARERRQFGRPIGRFQAVQHALANLAGEVAAAGAAAEAAVRSAEQVQTPAEALFEVASAKLRASEAAGKVAEIAHQVHAAIGFTERHVLRHATLRLWSWREEFGSETFWAERLGGLVARRGPEGLWPTITAPTPAGTAS